jgi:hypothetical protein
MKQIITHKRKHKATLKVFFSARLVQYEFIQERKLPFFQGFNGKDISGKVGTR